MDTHEDEEATSRRRHSLRTSRNWTELFFIHCDRLWKKYTNCMVLRLANKTENMAEIVFLRG